MATITKPNTGYIGQNWIYWKSGLLYMEPRILYKGWLCDKLLI